MQVKTTNDTAAETRPPARVAPQRILRIQLFDRSHGPADEEYWRATPTWCNGQNRNIWCNGPNRNNKEYHRTFSMFPRMKDVYQHFCSQLLEKKIAAQNPCLQSKQFPSNGLFINTRWLLLRCKAKPASRQGRRASLGIYGPGSD